MRAAIINKTPGEWLREIGEPPEKISEILGSFQKGAALRVCFYRADHLFLRFHGAKSSEKPRTLRGKKVDNGIWRPNYWMDGMALSSAFGRASQFEGWTTDARIRTIAKSYYREIAAVCHNWNDLRENELWKIQLRDAEVVVGLEGPVAPQPAFGATEMEPASVGQLSGGACKFISTRRRPSSARR